ncbi:alpha/beta hydrolase-fold protein [Pseudoalteromonas sp. BZB3]|uniref:alpha/beta hydrolase-fold protein n=1 Tax=Pseudoalteromonas sp. BZB3 TaxID=3136670 RepID=UPI0032C40676
MNIYIKIFIPLLFISTLFLCVLHLLDIPKEKTEIAIHNIEKTLIFAINANEINTLMLDNISKNKKVLIYNHGTVNPRKLNSCSKYVPSSITDNAFRDFFIIILCSNSIEKPYPKATGNYTFSRANEIKRLVDKVLEDGFSSNDIFLAGHSAGAWSSMLFASMNPEKYNSIIAFAPAFAGTRQSQIQYPNWRLANNYQMQKLKSGAPIRGLLFTYEKDPFMQPNDFFDLIALFSGSLRLISYDCHDSEHAHMTHSLDCMSHQTKSLIESLLSNGETFP